MLPEHSSPAGALLDRFAELAWATDTSSWLDGVVQMAAQLASCPLAQLYLLDATHTRLTLSAEWFEGSRRHETASLPSDYRDEQLLQYCLSQNRQLSIAQLDASLHQTGFLPESSRPWRSLLCLPLEDAEGHAVGLMVAASTASQDLAGTAATLTNLGRFGLGQASLLNRLRGAAQPVPAQIAAPRPCASGYSPLFSRSADFCALNAYHLAVMSAFVYAPFSTSKNPYASAPPPYSALGSIGYVLQNQLGRRIRPTQFNTALPYHLLCEEVPYSKRLEIMPYDPARYEKEAQEGWRNPEDVHFLHDTDNETNTNTQAFITHNDKVVLISIRGTQELLADASRDADARQVPYTEGEGQAHRGFYRGFQAAKPFIERYLNAFYTGEQTLVVCGHSLGGAIALLWPNGYVASPPNRT